MSPADESRKFVTYVTNWAQRAGGERGAIREMNDPEGRYYLWFRKQVSRFYYDTLEKLSGITREDFIHRCHLKILRWARENLDQLKEFTDRRLAGCIQKAAENLRNSLYRDALAKGYEVQEHEDCSEVDRLPAPEEAITFWDLDSEASRILLQTMPGFAETLRNEPKLLKTYVAILYSNEYASTDSLRCRIAYDVLARMGEHLPPYMQQHLKATFPQDDPKAISSRVTLLKKRLREYLMDKWGKQGLPDDLFD